MSKQSISSTTGAPEAAVDTMNSFAGKWALITGASSGLGLEFADLLAAQKVSLVLAARRQGPMEKLASNLRRKYGVDVLVEAIDLASPGAASRLKSSLDARSVAIDILLNNAGKWALITGASSGLGLEFADLLAAQKVNLVLAARRQEPMEKLASNLRRNYGVDVLVEAIDLASPGAASRLKSSLDARLVEIDILLNNAGYGLHGDFLETPIERTVDMIQLDITALTELTYLFGRDMATRRSGHILLVASLLAFQAVPSYAAYAATKAYVLALGEALHDELRPHGVIVTTLCPGHTATGFDAAAGATASAILRLLTMKPRPVAASGIRALLEGRAMVVAGLSNKMAVFSNRLTPRSMQRATMRRIMGS